MKSRIIVLFILVILCTKSIAQPAEEIYPGNIAKAGYMNDGSLGPFNIGFNFTFFGNSYNQFFVSPNGLVTFGSGQDNPVSNTIPSASTPNNFIAPFWDDLVIDPFGNILYKTIGAAPNRKLVVQFRNMAFYTSPPYMGTFSVILYESGSKIQVQYRMIVLKDNQRSKGGNATIGIENSDGTAGIQYAYHNPLAASTSKAILFTPSGISYQTDDNAVYDGTYLTTNLTLPEPGISDLISPTEGSIVGVDNIFNWTLSTNTSTNALQLATNPNLIGAVSYDAGSQTSYTINGLNPNTTYYWTVFTSNTTGFTWSEVKSFTTSTNPPLAPVPITIWTEQNTDKIINLKFTGGDAGAKTVSLITLPSQGKLFQSIGGQRGNQITSVPVVVSDTSRNVIYAASGGPGNGAGNFNFIVHDGTGDSPVGTVIVNIAAPRVPNLLYTAKSSNVEIQFDIPMSDPSGKQDQFLVKVNGVPAIINSASLKDGDPYSVILNLSTTLTGTETVLVSYTQGNISGSTGGQLLSFIDQPVNLKAQTITFPVIPDKEIGALPFNPGATASSSLGITYSSSNLSVATASGNSVTILTLGKSDITARQAGNVTYAPSKYIRQLLVNKHIQTITFAALPEKTYGDADFTISATATSGLTVSFASDNASVATVTGNTVHITGAGTAVITASQAGDATHSAATPVTQPLTVHKAVLTCTADNKTKDYLAALPALTYQITGFVNGENQSVIDNLPLAGTTCQVNSPADVYPITISGGNDNNYSFTYVAGTLTVLKINQTITITAYPEKLLYHDTYTLGATSTSGLTVLFESGDVSIASVDGNVITGVAKGNVTIRAYNNGDQNYYPAEATFSVEVYTTHRDILHLFTPNNDGFNDYWELPDLASWGKCDVRVFNRWGKLVFSDPDYNNLWDGTSSGSPLPEGAYYFMIKTQNAGVVKGTVNIVR